MNIKDLWALKESSNVLNEASKEEHLEMKLLDIEKFIKDNPSTKEITSSIFFTRIGQPDPEGLLSNEIFGLTKEERSGIYGYIDLHEYFIHPLIYKKLTRLDRKFRYIVHGTKTYSINSSGELVEDENGKTGMKWLKANFDKIKLKQSTSIQRKRVIKFIKDNRNVMFMKKLLVLPAYYRDVNTEAGGKVSVGEINELYASLITNVRGIKETADYGIDVSDAIRGRIQEGILAIYDWICGNNNALLEGSTGLSKKMGIVRRAGLSKTTDYGSRLVITAPNMKVEAIDDVMVDISHAAVPLASLLANFLPFVIYHVKRYIDNMFATPVPVHFKKSNKIEYIEVQDASLIYSDEVIKEEIERFIHGYSNRFRPFVYHDPETGKDIRFKFKGSTILSAEEYVKDMEAGVPPADSNLAAIGRDVTWCDILFLATNEAVQDKHVLITRYPIDSMYNQFPIGIVVSSTKETEAVYIDGKYYQYYPKIRQEDIGRNTSNTFVDSLRMSNLLLSAIGGDYDGDQVSSKGVFTKEANEECAKFIKSKFNYIGMDGSNIRKTTNEAVQSVYTLTMVMKEDKKKLTQPVF